jgi:hypothetical protein
VLLQRISPPMRRISIQRLFLVIAVFAVVFRLWFSYWSVITDKSDEWTYHSWSRNSTDRPLWRFEVHHTPFWPRYWRRCIGIALNTRCVTCSCSELMKNEWSPYETRYAPQLSRETELQMVKNTGYRPVMRDIGVFIWRDSRPPF